MGRKSSLTSLPPEIQAAVIKALEGDATIDQIVRKLAELGHERSRSAVGRFAQDYRDLAARQRDMRSVAEAFGREFGDHGNAQGKLLVQLITSVAARATMKIATADDPDLDGQELHFFARAAKDILSAAKIDADRDAKIREEAKKEAREKAAQDAETAARSAGASQETIDRVKAKILGLDA